MNLLLDIALIALALVAVLVPAVGIFTLGGWITDRIHDRHDRRRDALRRLS